MSRLVPALVLLSSALLAGCATPYAVPRYDPPEARFEGLYDMALVQPEGGSLDVFVVHGMCDHDEKWAREAIKRLSMPLGTVALQTGGTGPASGITTTVGTVVVEGRTVRFSALVWSALTRDAKASLCYDQSTKTGTCIDRTEPKPYPYPWDRARINAGLKNTILDECLADMLVYQGRARSTIVQQMRDALFAARAAPVAAFATLTTPAGPDRARIARASTANRAPLVVITESLGSKIVFDSLTSASTTATVERAATASLAESVTAIFMLANQLPALRLADAPLPAQDSRTAMADEAPAPFAPDPVAALLRQRVRSAARVDAPVRVVAFSDPSDLLSYTLKPYVDRLPEKDRYEVADVIVSNGPTTFGLLADPRRAHVTYIERDAVVSDIVCGRPRNAACR